MIIPRLAPTLLGCALAGLAGGLFFGSIAEAEAAMRTQVSKNSSSAKIGWYDSLCDDDNALECMVAEIGCDSPGDFTAYLYALDNKEAASVFAKGSGRAAIVAGGGGVNLQVSKVALSPYSYKWNAVLISYDKAQGLWGSIWKAPTIEFQLGAKKVVLRRGDVNERSFQEAVSVCGSAS